MKKCRVAIISDTHSLLRPQVLEILEMCDYIIHGGDITSQAVLEELKKIAPVYAVRGNNDKAKWAKELPVNLTFEIAGCRFYMVHNKAYAPKVLPDTDVFVYGHSHQYHCTAYCINAGKMAEDCGMQYWCGESKVAFFSLYLTNKK